MELFKYKKFRSDEIPTLTIDQSGLENLKKDIENKQNELIKLQLEARKKLTNVELEWNESSTHKDEIAMLKYEIERLKAIVDNANIINDTESLEKNVINIGDVVEVNLIYSSLDKERMILRLETIRQSKTDDGIEVISVDSPLGSALYHAEVGTSVKFGKNKEFKAEILSKINTEKKEEEVNTLKQFSKK